MKDLPARRGTLLEEEDVFGAKRFYQAARSSFPGLSAHVSAKDGVHLVTAALANEARAALQGSDVGRAVETCRFLEHAMGRPNADPEIANAAEISFLDPSDLMGSSAARELAARMPVGMRRALLRDADT